MGFNVGDTVCGISFEYAITNDKMLEGIVIKNNSSDDMIVLVTNHVESMYTGGIYKQLKHDLFLPAYSSEISKKINDFNHDYLIDTQNSQNITFFDFLSSYYTEGDILSTNIVKYFESNNDNRIVNNLKRYLNVNIYKK